jgi:hypothetical protein
MDCPGGRRLVAAPRVDWRRGSHHGRQSLRHGTSCSSVETAPPEGVCSRRGRRIGRPVGHRVPPLRRARRISDNALWISGMSMSAKREITTSNESAGSSSCWASIIWVWMFGKPACRAAIAVSSSMLGEMSVPSTVPVMPTRRAAPSVWSPEPAPMSSTRLPARMRARSWA